MKTNKIKLIIFLSIVSFFVKAQSCICTDYIYLNDPQNSVNGFVHKFKINSSGLLIEIPNGVTGTMPWFPTGGGLPEPHGLGQDLNGNLYIGETNSGKVRKLSCDGVISPTTSYQINDGGFNFNSYNGILYINSKNSDEIRSYDLCTGVALGYVKLGSFVGDDWGFSIATDGTFYVTNSSFNGTVENVYRFKPTTLDFTNHTVYSPFITKSSFPPSGKIGATWGITSDLAGNFYVLFEDDNSENGTYDTFIAKFNAAGTLIASYQEPWTFDNVGIERARGLIYYAPSNILYVAAGQFGDCVAKINAATMTYAGAAVGNMPGQNPKGIALARECCSISPNLLADTTVCKATIGDKLFLQKLIGSSCDGPVCGGTWSADPMNTGVTFNTCDASIVVNNPSGCGIFTMSGGGGFSECAAFNLTVKVDFSTNQIISAIPSSQGICTGLIPTILTVSSSSIRPLTYQWQKSTSNCTIGFSNIIGANTSTYSPPALTTTTYYRALVSEVGACNYGACQDTSACITVTVNPLPNFTLASKNVTCNGLNNGTITITTTSGTSPFTFGTDDGVSFPNATGIFNNLVPAAYKPAVKDANGCVRKCN